MRSTILCLLVSILLFISKEVSAQKYNNDTLYVIGDSTNQKLSTYSPSSDERFCEYYEYLLPVLPDYAYLFPYKCRNAKFFSLKNLKFVSSINQIDTTILHLANKVVLLPSLFETPGNFKNILLDDTFSISKIFPNINQLVVFNGEYVPKKLVDLKKLHTLELRFSKIYWRAGDTDTILEKFSNYQVFPNQVREVLPNLRVFNTNTIPILPENLSQYKKLSMINEGIIDSSFTHRNDTLLPDIHLSGNLPFVYPLFYILDSKWRIKVENKTGKKIKFNSTSLKDSLGAGYEYVKIIDPSFYYSILYDCIKLNPSVLLDTVFEGITYKGKPHGKWVFKNIQGKIVQVRYYDKGLETGIWYAVHRPLQFYKNEYPVNYKLDLYDTAYTAIFNNGELMTLKTFRVIPKLKSFYDHGFEYVRYDSLIGQCFRDKFLFPATDLLERFYFVQEENYISQKLNNDSLIRRSVYYTYDINEYGNIDSVFIEKYGFERSINYLSSPYTINRSMVTGKLFYIYSKKSLFWEQNGFVIPLKHAFCYHKDLIEDQIVEYKKSHPTRTIPLKIDWEFRYPKWDVNIKYSRSVQFVPRYKSLFVTHGKNDNLTSGYTYEFVGHTLMIEKHHNEIGQADGVWSYWNLNTKKKIKDEIYKEGVLIETKEY